MPLFTISIDNREPGIDYYEEHFLRPSGEGGKFRAQGGFVRDRPLPRPPRRESTWLLEDFSLEVRRAMELGIDGFVYDITDDSDQAVRALEVLLVAIEREGLGRFGLILMPDMTTEWARDPKRLVSVIRRILNRPGLFREGGKVVVAPYLAEQVPPAGDVQGRVIDGVWWRDRLKELASESRVPIAFVPLFQGWEQFSDGYASWADGVSDWGVRTARGYASFAASLARIRGRWRDRLVMAPVAPQDARPKDYVYQEAAAAQLLREGFGAARAHGADWVQLVTWNDYSESTHVSPSVRTGWAYAELVRFYGAWFKGGGAPAILKDCLVYLYRPHSTRARPDLAKQARRWRLLHSNETEIDIVEVTALLTAPATVRVSTTLGSSTFEAPAGVSVFRVPLAEGIPRFELIRAGAVLLDEPGIHAVNDRIEYQSLVYRGGVAVHDTTSVDPLRHGPIRVPTNKPSHAP